MSQEFKPIALPEVSPKSDQKCKTKNVDGNVGLEYHPFYVVIFNTSRPRRTGRHFPDDIFKCIFVTENFWISITISLKFVPKGPINNSPTLVQIMAWRRPGAKPFSEPMMVDYWRIYASLGLNDLSRGTCPLHRNKYGIFSLFCNHHNHKSGNAATVGILLCCVAVWSRDWLIFKMGIPLSVRSLLYIETAPEISPYGDPSAREATLRNMRKYITRIPRDVMTQPRQNKSKHNYCQTSSIRSTKPKTLNVSRLV